MSAQRIASLREVAEVARKEGELSYALRDFLDGFYPAPDAATLRDEPGWLEPDFDDGGIADAYLAAVADHLCRAHRLQRPTWINNPRRVLKVPFFAAKTHGLRMVYLQESPTAFRQRNIFVSANALARA